MIASGGATMGLRVASNGSGPPPRLLPRHGRVLVPTRTGSRSARRLGFHLATGVGDPIATHRRSVATIVPNSCRIVASNIAAAGTKTMPSASRLNCSMCHRGRSSANRGTRCVGRRPLGDQPSDNRRRREDNVRPVPAPSLARAGTRSPAPLHTRRPAGGRATETPPAARANGRVRRRFGRDTAGRRDATDHHRQEKRERAEQAQHERP